MRSPRFLCYVLMCTSVFFVTFAIFDYVTSLKSIESLKSDQPPIKHVNISAPTVRRRYFLNTSTCAKYVNTRLYTQFRGLGNNMFQYAGILGISSMCNQVCPTLSAADVNSLKQRFPNLTALANDDNYVGYNFQTAERIYDQQLIDRWNCSYSVTCDNYLHSWRYFHPHLQHQLKTKDFRFSDNIQQTVDRFIDESLDNTNCSNRSTTHLVVIHARVFDRNSIGLLSGNKETFDRGVTQVRLNLKTKSDIKSVIYIVASNDANWKSKDLPPANEKFSFEEFLFFSSLKSGEADMALLTRADTVVICASGSTFAWWGAYLSSATVYYAKEHSVVNSATFNNTNPSDYFLPYWIPI